MGKRDYIPLKTQLAAALCQVFNIPWDAQKAMSEDKIIALGNLHHHPYPKAQGGPDVHWNLEWMLEPDHKIETAKKTIPTIAKTKRITKANEEFRRRILAKTAGEDPPPAKFKRKWPSRPVPGSKNSPWKKHADGRVSKR